MGVGWCSVVSLVSRGMSSSSVLVLVLVLVQLETIYPGLASDSGYNALQRVYGGGVVDNAAQTE